MDSALLMARMTLAFVFVVAGLAKLLDRAGSRQAMLDFGVPAPVAPLLGVLLPFSEIAVAVALVPVVSAWWGAAGALALLVGFLAAIGINLSRGRRPECHCFGQLHSSPVGWRTLLRNLVLAFLAGFVVLRGRDDPGPSVVGWIRDLPTQLLVGLVGGVVALALLALLIWLVANLLRQNGRLLLRLDALEQRLAAAGIPALPAGTTMEPEAGLPVGTVAPPFQLPGVYGESLTLDSLRAAGKPVLLVFADPDCGPCNALLPEIGRWQRVHAGNVTIAIVSRGPRDANRAKSEEHGLTNVLLQDGRKVSEAYLENATPSAVLVRPDGTIGSPMAGGADAIRSLVSRTVGTAGSSGARVAPEAMNRLPTAQDGNGSGAPPAPKLGELAPAFRLPDLSNRMVELATFRGKKTVVLFWNPGCGFCQRMLDDVKAWEAKPPKAAPKVLVVSTGTVEANRSLGLRSKVVLDQSFGVGTSFGANGTPMAVLIDERGRIASDVAAGAERVMALLRDGVDPAGTAAG